MDRYPGDDRRVVSSGLKLLLFLLGLTAAGYCLVYFRIADALLEFSFGGTVPGTDTVMSPDAQLRMVAVIFAVCLGLVTLKIILRRRKQLVAPPSAGHIFDMPESLLPPHIRITDKFHLHRDLIVATSFDTMRNASSRASLMLGIAGGGSQALLVRIFGGFVRVATASTLTLVLAMRLLWHTLALVWKWAEPRLRRLDGWLETQVRKFEHKTVDVLYERDTTRFVAVVVRQYAARLKDVIVPPGYQAKQHHSQFKRKP